MRKFFSTRRLVIAAIAGVALLSGCQQASPFPTTLPGGIGVGGSGCLSSYGQVGMGATVQGSIQANIQSTYSSISSQGMLPAAGGAIQTVAVGGGRPINRQGFWAGSLNGYFNTTTTGGGYPGYPNYSYGSQPGTVMLSFIPSQSFVSQAMMQSGAYYNNYNPGFNYGNSYNPNLYNNYQQPCVSITGISFSPLNVDNSGYVSYSSMTVNVSVSGGYQTVGSQTPVPVQIY